MSSSEARQKWRDKRTKYVTEFCATNKFKLEFLNEGYQLRIEGVMDIYPTNGRWHFLPTGERGDWHTDNDLKITMLEMLDKVAPKTYDINKGEQPIHGVELTGVNKVTVHDVTPFAPKPYQMAVFEKLAEGEPLPLLQWGRRPYSVGVDMGVKDGDKTVITKAYKGHNGKTIMVFDEYANWPEYKWYRNPIKWWKFRQVTKMLERQYHGSSNNR